MNIKGLEFDQTCEACPEQYDVYYDELQVGYVRLRWGNLTVTYPDYDGEVIYREGIGEGLTGMFESEEQRKHYLDIIADKILEKIEV